MRLASRTLRRLVLGKSLPPGLRGRQLCFLHIGKTAGTSVQHALFEAMRYAKIFHESLENFDKASAAELAHHDLVIGHFMYQHVCKLKTDRFLMTFLRDPVERVISNYHFLRSGSPVSAYSKRAIAAAKALTLEEFLRCADPGVRMVTENFQAKALAHDIRPEHQSAISNLRRQAEQNLSTFDFVGIVEHFDTSMAAVSSAIGVDLNVKKLNVTAVPSAQRAASAAQMNVIRKLNEIDIGLYAQARERFERSLLPRLSLQGPPMQVSQASANV
jgi:Sulfotransferase family